MDFWQIFTLITGIAYMILEIRQKNFMWVVGVATSLAAMLVFFREGLYASFGLNTYYFITAFIGLWHWRRDKKTYSADVQPEVQGGDVIVLNRLSRKTVVISAVVTVAGTVALSYGMEWMNSQGFLKENPMSLLDSGVAVLSAVATWWLVKSYIQQWWLWIVADTLSVVLCAVQGMWWMAVLYVAYVIAAAWGLCYWKKRGVYLGDTQ
jgi:nicotinamide mononucleotide transporter